VIRHRVDVKWRLQPGDFERHARQQVELLTATARLVTPSGRLVYSTCSLDAEENERVVAAFLADAGGEFTLEAQVLSRPPESKCDGAAAFLLRRA
jgi:16S rRNA (cytosine967-C5)-methyltransferase